MFLNKKMFLIMSKCISLMSGGLFWIRISLRSNACFFKEQKRFNILLNVFFIHNSVKYFPF